MQLAHIDFLDEQIAALNLLRQEHTHQMSLRQKRLLCSLDEHYLLTVLSRAT
jgi:hypothetical protein